MLSRNHASFLAVIQLVRRRSRAALLALLSVELLLAAAWRLPWTMWFPRASFAVSWRLAVHLGLAAWCAGFAASAPSERDDARATGLAIDVGFGATLAFLGAFADYLPLAANAVAVAGLPVLAWLRRPARSPRLLAAAAGVLAGSIAAVAATALLYGEQMGFASYRDAITLRVAQRTGTAPFAEHLDVIRRQSLTA